MTILFFRYLFRWGFGIYRYYEDDIAYRITLLIVWHITFLIYSVLWGTGVGDWWIILLTAKIIIFTFILLFSNPSFSVQRPTTSHYSILYSEGILPSALVHVSGYTVLEALQRLRRPRGEALSLTAPTSVIQSRGSPLPPSPTPVPHNTL